VWWATKQDAPPEFPDSPARWALCIAALGVYAVATGARGWRWHVILRHGGIEHEVRDAYALTVVGYMGNTVLPARGGEALRVLLLAERTGVRRREILGAILPERLLDVAALATLFCVLTFAGTGDSPAGTLPAIIAAIALVLGLVGLVAYLRLRIAGRFARFADRVRPVARASRLLLTTWGAGLFALSGGVWFCEALVFWLAAESIHVGLSLLEALLVVVLGSFLALVPAGPGYAGTYDAAMLFALRAVDVPKSAALGCVILFRFVVFVPITVVGLVLMVTRYGGLGRVLHRPSGAPSSS
jgi:glycosyltransferase 2 family protein